MKEIKIRNNIIKITIVSMLLLILGLMAKLLFFRLEDCDVFFLISNGHYIAGHGVPKNMFWGLDSSLPTVIQQWMCSIWTYIFYAMFGDKGINVCKVFNFCIMSGGIYLSLRYFTSGKTKRFFITILASFFIVASYILVRPYPITVLTCFLLTGVSHRYLKEENKKDLGKYYLLVFLIYCFQANWQCASLVILCCFSACFIITKKGIDLRAVLSYLPAFVGGLVNPNGIDAWAYTFKSYEATQVYVIQEMTKFSFTDCQILLVVVLGILYFSSIKEWKKYPLWIHFLTLGSVFSSVMAPRNTYMCLIPFIVLFAWGSEKYNIEEIGIFKYPGICFVAIFVVYSTLAMNLPYKSAVEVPEDIIPKNCVLYTAFNSGAYFINQGHQIFIDARPELYSEAFIGDKAYLNEAHDAEYVENFDRDSFVQKYGFEYFAVPDSTYMYQWCRENCEFVYYDGLTTYIFKK